MAVAIASNLRKEIAGEPLFEGVSFSLERRDRLSLAGRNGAGKTTLLRILADELRSDGGELVLEKSTRVALHDQRPPLERNLTLREYVLSGSQDLIGLEAELAGLEQAMSSGAHDSATLARYSHAQASFEKAGGYLWRERAGIITRGLGFRDADLDRQLKTFSGGELTRASLGRALSAEPDLLLLDEPTNHLDIESLEWLERKLVSLDAACVIVAHDRWFLEATSTAVLELERGHGVFFPGQWHRWRQEKLARQTAQDREAQRQTERIAQLEYFVGRFRYGTKARQAQAKLKMIERIERNRVRAVAGPEQSLAFEFRQPKRSGRRVLTIRDVTVSAGGEALLRDVNLDLDRGDHLALVGPNGSGKTTLLESVVSGAIPTGHAVEIGYLSQQDVDLDREGTVLDCVQNATGVDRPDAQALLGRFLFSGWDAHQKPMRALSGGERRRLALAILVSSGANFLILDEPTNHLDLESREALEAALESYEGTVLLVSHDRALVDAVADRLAVVDDHSITTYHGGWAEYAERRSENVEEEPAATAAAKAPAPRTASAQPATEPDTRELTRLEERIEEQERLVAELESHLSANWSDAEAIQAHKEARARLDSLLARWEELAGAAEGS